MQFSKLLAHLLTLVVAMGGLACGSGGLAQTQPPAGDALEKAEKEECKKNLEAIYKAITAYRKDRHDLPMWLSGLVPKYLPDANLLVCPVCRRTGAIETPPLSDPKLPSSYLFEFCPVPLGNLNPGDPSRTRREWKRRQMGIIGSLVPIVRCRHHDPSLNLSFDGQIYEAPSSAWELAFTNMASLESLRASSLFAGEARKRRPKYPARNPKATPNQIDLSKFYNVGLNENWLGRTNENFSSMPKGLKAIDGVTFDLRGLVQLSGKGLNKEFPGKVGAIPVRLKCKKLYFLNALAGWTPNDAGKLAGTYRIKFVGNNARVEIPLICGKELGFWKGGNVQQGEGPKPVWVGSLPAGAGQGRLFKTTWNNLAPDLEIESIEVVSEPTMGGILLAAIAAE